MTFLDFFGARYFLKGLAITASIAAFLTLAAVINGLLSGIVATLPAWANVAVYWLPTNTGACIGAIITAYIARWAYDFQRTRLMMIGNG